MKFCACETVLSAIHANMTAYTAIHCALAADLYAGVVLHCGFRGSFREVASIPTLHSHSMW